MADVNANIGVHIDTSAALAELKNLQRGLAQFHASINKSSAAAAAAQRDLQQNLMNSINATGRWTAQMRTIRTSTEAFTHSLEKNKFSMGEYFRYAGGATKTFGRLFKSEFDTIGKVAEDRVKRMQTQYIKMGRDASGAMRAIAITPTRLNLDDHNTQLALAAQRQALFNQLVKQGSTSLLNFGKNTQWAGRQLMVGFTIPLMYFGSTASKVFMDLEAQALKFRRVYGDTFTSTAETQKALDDIRRLAEEFTKYGVAVSQTMEMAASAAAMGKVGADLTAQVAQATKLSVLGQVEQQQALETTISLTNAFGIAAEDLAEKINFLNAVENQTVVSIEDLTIAIPKAGPVVQQLGGSVEDLAFFLTAMKEGGINASEGANALKSGLASLINPTEKAADMLLEMGINLKAIVEGNAGNVKQIVLDFASALDTLDPLTRARAIEQLFGKFQFARLSTLFQNVNKDGTQASRVLDLAGKSVEELAILSERELGKVEDAIGTKFRAELERLKVAIEPVGKAFLQAVTPIIKFASDLLSKFNDLGDGTQKFIVVATTLVGVIGPTFLMAFGLIANGAANIIKLFLNMRLGFQKLTGDSKVLGQGTQYLTSEQMENETVAASLNQAHSRLTQQFLVESKAVDALRNAYIQATSAASRFASVNPGMMLPGGRGRAPREYNKGVTTVPGRGNKDTVAALLTPGEAVIPKSIAQDPRFAPIIEAMVAGTIKGFNEGTANAQPGASQASQRVRRSKQPGDDFAHVGKGQRMPIESLIADADMRPEQRSLLTAYSQILSANNKPTDTLAYRRLGYYFPKNLNIDMAKGGANFAEWERAWIERPDKWSASGISRNDALIVDNEILQKIRSYGLSRVTDDDIEKAFNDLSNDAKNSAGYARMRRMQNVFGEFSIGAGLGSNPATAREILQNAQRAGVIRGFNIVARSDNPDKISSMTVIDRDGNAINFGRGARAERRKFARGKDPGFNLAVAPGEQIVGTDGRRRAVSGTTGERRTRDTRVVGGGPRDRRIISARNIAAILPQAIAALRRPAFGAEDGWFSDLPEGRRELARQSRAMLYGGGPTDPSQKSLRRQQETQSKRRLKAIKDEIRAIEDGNKSRDKNNDSTKNNTKSQRTLTSKITTGANVMTAVTFAATMLPGAIGEFAQKLAPAAMVLSTLMMLGPGLKTMALKLGAFLVANPFVAVAAAIALVAVGLKLIQKRNKEQAEAQSVYIDTISATTEKMKQIGEITGEVGASEIMQRVRERGTADRYLTGFNRAGQQFGTEFLQSEVGAQLLKTFTEEFKKDRGGAVQNLGLELASYVSDGVMTALQAQSVSRALGIALGDMSISTGIDAQLRSLVGQDGVDLLKDPITVRMRIAQESINEIKNTLNGITSDVVVTPTGGAPGQRSGAPVTSTGTSTVTAPGQRSGVPVTSTGTPTGTGTVSTSGMTAQEQRLILAGSAAQSIQALETLQAQRDAQSLYYEDQIRSLEAEKAKAKTLEEQQIIQGKIDALRKSQIADDQKLANLSNQLFNNQKMLLQQAESSGQITAIMQSANKQITEKFKGTAQEDFAAAFISRSDQIKDTELRLKLKTFVGTNLISPANANNLMTLFAGKETELSAVVNSKVVTQNPTKFNELVGIMNTVTGPNAGKIRTEIITTMTSPGGEAKFDQRMGVLNQLTMLDGKEINMDVFLREEGAMDKIDKLAGQFEVIEKIPDVNEKTLSVQAKGMPELQAMIDGWEHYKNLPEEVQKTAVQTFMTIFTTMSTDPNQRRQIAQAVAAQRGMRTPDRIDEFVERMTNTQDIDEIAKLAQEYNKALYEALNAGDGTTPPDGPKKPDDGARQRSTLLDDLMRKLRNTRDAAIKAEGGIKELRRAINAGIREFDGFETQLIKAGANRQFVGFLSNLDNEALKTYVNMERLKQGIVELTDDGIRLRKAFNEATIGEFNLAQVMSIQNVKQQEQAFLKLRAAGVDVATAYELIADEQLAVAITAGVISDDELKTLANTAIEAKKAIKDMNEQLQLSSFIVGELDKISILKEIPGLIDKLNRFGLNAEQVAAVLDNPALTNQLIKDLSDGVLNSEQIVEYLNSIPVRKRLEFEINMKTPEGRLKEFSELQSKAEELFAILEADIADQEEKINKLYEERIVALTKISEINSDIARQQKQQLDIADALTRGDISAAARITQEARAQQSDASIQASIEALKQQQKAQIEALRAPLNLMREAWSDSRIAIDKQRIAQGEFNAIITMTNTLMEAVKGNADGIAPAIWKAVDAANKLNQIPLTAPVAVPNAPVTSTPEAPAQPKIQYTYDPTRQMVVPLSEARVVTWISDSPQGASRLAGTVQTTGGSSAGSRIGAIGSAVRFMANGGPVKYYPMGGLVPYMANGGMFKSVNTDSVPAMLTAGEFVVRRAAVKDFGVQNLEKINSGAYTGDSVYNYNLSVNVKSDANPDDIARTVMTQIRNIDTQRVRGQR